MDGQGAQPGILRAAAHPGDRRVWRLRLARPVRLLPLLRDRRAADVPAHRHLGFVGRGAAAGHLRLGIRSNRRRHQRVRGDEADPLSAVRVGLHPGRHSRAVCRHRIAVVLVPDHVCAAVRPDAADMGLPRVLCRLRDPRRHLAAPHLVTGRTCVGTDRGVDAARRRADEARGIRSRPARYGTASRRPRSNGPGSSAPSPASTSFTVRSAPWRSGT